MNATTCASRIPRIPYPLLYVRTCLLALAVLLVTGCAPHMKAEVHAVSAPGFRAAGQSYVLAPGTWLATLHAVGADMFRLSTQRLRAVLAGHGYREAAGPETADMAVVVDWKVDEPHPAVPAASDFRPSQGIGLGYGLWPWYGGRFGGWGYGRYGGLGAVFGSPQPMTLLYAHTLSIEARDLRPDRTGGGSVAGDANRAPTSPTTPPDAPGDAHSLAARPTNQPATDLPDYARPPYGTPLGVVAGLPSAVELTGPVLWRVVVSGTGSSRDIRSALPALVTAASRWIGVTASVKVRVDGDLNVTIQGP